MHHDPNNAHPPAEATTAELIQLCRWRDEAEDAFLVPLSLDEELTIIAPTANLGATAFLNLLKVCVSQAPPPILHQTVSIRNFNVESLFGRRLNLLR